LLSAAAATDANPANALSIPSKISGNRPDIQTPTCVSTLIF
jgi:hypothetical protein